MSATAWSNSSPEQRARREARNVEIIERYGNGESFRGIASTYGMNHETVRRILIREGVVEKGERHEPMPELERVLALLAEGVPLEWVAEDVGVCKKTISQYARRVPGRKALVAESAGVWLQITRAPELNSLHREFSPNLT